MICSKCGRKTKDSARYCKGCGAALHKPERIKRDGIVHSMNNTVTENSSVKAWYVVAMVLAVISVLVVSLYAYPYLRDYISDSAADIEQIPQQEKENDPSALGIVIGPIMVIDSNTFTVSDTDVVASSSDAVTVKGDDRCKMTINDCYDDGSWYREYVISDAILIRLIRIIAVDDFIINQVQKFYPDVENVESFADSPVVSGYESTRIQFTDTTEDKTSVVDVLGVSTDEYDYTAIIETPADMYSVQELNITDWLSHLIIKDAQTGELYFAPVISSDSDMAVSSGDAMYDDYDY